MSKTATSKVWDVMHDLGIVEAVEKGERLTQEWEKKTWDSIQKSAKKWHDAGREGSLDIFTGIEELINTEFPKLDPLVEIEVAYYITAIAKEILVKKSKEIEDGKTT